MKKTLTGIIAAAVLLGVVIGAVKLVTGIIGGAFNLILGIAVIIALIVIVIWMFAYANKKKK
ncbi:MAG: hypothetical protein Q4E35_02670 [Eubacteriales bacterium]|nr:hypothetical protein [Eubacteriales bacterium]